MSFFQWLLGKRTSLQRREPTRYMCKSKDDILNRLAYMVVYAPNFPPEDQMTLDLAFESLEFGLKFIEAEDGRPVVVGNIERVRLELAVARKLFDAGQPGPASHKLQDAEDVLRPVRVKQSVA